MSTMYDYAVINVMNFSAGEKRAELLRAFSSVRCSRIGKLAILGDRELLLLIELLPKTQRTAGEMEEMIAEFMKSVGEIIHSAEMKCGICREGNTLRDIRKCVEKCRRVIEMGSIIRPDNAIWDYEMLGPLTWIDIPEDELNGMLARFRPLMSDDRGSELLHTLKVYLENNMNYSLTSELLFVHINTIRKRIDRIMEDTAFEGVDWNNTVERVKLILLLQFLEAGE